MFRVKCLFTQKLKNFFVCALYLLLSFNQDSCWSQDNAKSLHVIQIANTVIEIQGSMCPACLKKLEDHLAKLAGIINVHIESKWDLRVPENKRNKIRDRCALLYVSFRKNETNLDDIFEIIKTDGFEARMMGD